MKTNTNKAPAKAKTTPRTIYTIRWDKRLQCWVTKVEGFIVHAWKGLTKVEAINVQANHCLMHWFDSDILSELRICNKAGQYQPARTYGKDPKRSIG